MPSNKSRKSVKEPAPGIAHFAKRTAEHDLRSVSGVEESGF